MNRQLRALALSPFVRQRLTMFIASSGTSDLERLADLIETGRVTPSVERTYPLHEPAAAMRHLAGRSHTREGRDQHLSAVRRPSSRP